MACLDRARGPPRYRRPDGAPGGEPRDDATPEPGPPVGYRRDPVAISHEGWALEVPGSFAERRIAEEWWGGGAGRNITLAATATGLPDGTADAAQTSSSSSSPWSWVRMPWRITPARCSAGRA